MKPGETASFLSAKKWIAVTVSMAVQMCITDGIVVATNASHPAHRHPRGATFFHSGTGGVSLAHDPKGVPPCQPRFGASDNDRFDVNMFRKRGGSCLSL
jgi:hypothetical protein